jgi:hypothetical protein
VSKVLPEQDRKGTFRNFRAIRVPNTICLKADNVPKFPKDVDRNVPNEKKSIEKPLLAVYLLIIFGRHLLADNLFPHW